MKRAAAGLALAAGLATCAAADTPRRMADAAERADLSAIGRLNIGGRGFCTATLIAPDVVVTAAHCLSRANGDGLVAADALHFLPGYDRGTYSDHQRGAATVRAPGFAPEEGPHDDLALVQLQASAAVAPLTVATAGDGARLSVASYGADRSQALSIQKDCGVVESAAGAFATDCEGLPGMSGAPLMRRTAGGYAVVGIVSAVTADRRAPIVTGRIIAVRLTPDRVARLIADLKNHP